VISISHWWWQVPTDMATGDKSKWTSSGVRWHNGVSGREPDAACVTAHGGSEYPSLPVPTWWDTNLVGLDCAHRKLASYCQCSQGLVDKVLPVSTPRERTQGKSPQFSCLKGPELGFQLCLICVINGPKHIIQLPGLIL
jgi:hypothetical protein